MPLLCTTLSGPRLCAFLFDNHFDVFPYLLCLSHLVVRPCSKCFLEEQQHQDTTSRDSLDMALRRRTKSLLQRTPLEWRSCCLAWSAERSVRLPENCGNLPQSDRCRIRCIIFTLFYILYTYLDLESCLFKLACCCLQHLSWLWPLLQMHTCCSTNGPLSCYCQVNVATYLPLTFHGFIHQVHPGSSPGKTIQNRNTQPTWHGFGLFRLHLAVTLRITLNSFLKLSILYLYSYLFLHLLENTPVHNPFTSPSHKPFELVWGLFGEDRLKPQAMRWNGYWSNGQNTGNLGFKLILLAYQWMLTMFMPNKMVL
jgi:hypothetical protein